MDFRSLTRKELQTLCKKNKIPANITNISMADALTALENVVGLEEFINQSQSPDKMAPESESPSINLRSASTRRKPINADPETAQPMTCTRRATTRRTKVDQDQENKKNFMETPAVPASRRRETAPKEREISNDNTIETPLVPTNRKRQPSGSVQRTRQSVRLLEKSLAELSLKKKGREKPVNIMDVSECDAVASFEKSNDTQVSSSLENEEKIKHDVQQQQNKVDGREANTQNSDYLNNHVSGLIAKKDDVDDETFDDLLTDKSNKVKNEMGTEFPSEEVMDLEHCLAADKISEENSEIGNVSEEIMEPTSEEIMKAEHCLHVSNAAESCVEKGMMILEQVTVARNNPKVDTKELIDVSLIEAEVRISNGDETPKFVKQISHPYKENIPLSTSFTEDNPDSTTKILLDVYIMQTDAFENQMNDGDSVSGSKFTCRDSMSPLGADPLPIPVSGLIAKKDDVDDETFDDLLTDKSNKVKNEMGTEFPSEEVMDLEQCLAADKISEENSEIGNVSEEIMEPISEEIMKAEHCLHVSNEAESCVEKGMMILEQVTVARNNPKVDTKELIDVSLIEAEVRISNGDETPKFVKQIGHPYKENIPLSTSFTEDNPDSTTKILFDVYVMQTDAFGNQLNDGDSVSGSKFTCRDSMSPLGADPLPIQFPRPTPIKSSSEKQAASEKLIIVDADNKENIDSSGKKVWFKTDEVKKNKNKIDKDMMLKSLEDQSLRQLSKMLKQKLQINNPKRKHC